MSEWAFCPSRDLTVVRTSGSVKIDDLRAWVVRFCMGTATKFVLWDMTQADIFKLSAEEICIDEQNTVDFAGSRNVRKAAIVSVDDSDDGVAKTLKALCGVDEFPFEVQFFTRFGEAMEWLVGRPNPVTAPYRQPATGHEMLHR